MAASFMTCSSIWDQIAVRAAPVTVVDWTNRLFTTGSFSSEMLVLPVGEMAFPAVSESRNP